MHTVPSASLRVLRSKLSQAVTSGSNIQVLLSGPEGRGKTSLLKSIIKQGFRDYAFSYYDFKVNAHHNFQVMLMQWSSSLISQNSLIQRGGLTQSAQAFDDLRREISETDSHIKTFFERILSYKHLAPKLSSHIRHITGDNVEVNGELWNETCQLLRKHAPWTMGVKESSAISDVEAFYYSLVALAIIAEKVELEKQGEPNPNYILTGKWATHYLLSVYRLLSHQLNTKWVLCLDGIEQLTSSPFLNDRGGTFLDQIISRLQTNKLSSVLISDTSTPFIKLVDESLHNKINGVFMKPPEETQADATTIEGSGLVFLDVPEVETAVSTSMLREHIWNCDKISKALTKVCGGNLSLISKVIASYRILEDKLDLSGVQQILAGSTNPVDDEYFPFKESLEDQMLYLQEERCKMFVRNLHNMSLKKDVGRFENLMNQFLSLPLMESLKKGMENRVHFWVTVSETIRYMLRKPMLQLKPGASVDNTVVLALIASGIVHLNLYSRTLDFKDSLTRLLIETYINNEYERLSWIHQVEYKANYLLNQKVIYRELDRMLL